MRILTAIAAIVLWAGSLSASLAQLDITSDDLVPLTSNNSKGFSEGWNVSLFIDPEFNCTDLSKTNTYYLVLHDEEYNRFPERLKRVVLKALVVFNFEQGPARCIFNYRDPDSTHKFRVIALYDDEVVLNLPFNIGFLEFTSKTTMRTFNKDFARLFKPVLDKQPDPSTVAKMAPKTDKVFLGKAAFYTYTSTDSLLGANIVFCHLSGGAGSQNLLRKFGAQIDTSLLIKSEQELAKRLLSQDCDTAPHNQSVEALMAKIAAYKPDTSDSAMLQARDKIYYEKEQLTFGRETPWVITLTGDANTRLKKADAFLGRYQHCGRNFDNFARNLYDCNCVAMANSPDTGLSQCLTSFAYMEGKYKAFDYIKSFEYDIWKEKPQDQQIGYVDTLAECAAKKYEADILKTLPTSYKKSGTFKRLLSRFIPACMKSIQ